jgi:hypothetical protein
VAALLASLATAGPGEAGERRGATNPCAAHGAGFVPLSGTSSCVRIGGRVRVEFGASGGAGSQWRVAPQAGAASGAALPNYAAPGGGAAQPRLRPVRQY